LRRSRMSSNAFSATLTSGEGEKEISIASSTYETRNTGFDTISFGHNHDHH